MLVRGLNKMLGRFFKVLMQKIKVFEFEASQHGRDNGLMTDNVLMA